MVAERITDLEAKFVAMEAKFNEEEKRSDDLEAKMKEMEERQDDDGAKRNSLAQSLKTLEEIKDIFGSDLQGELMKMKTEAEQRHAVSMNDLKTVVAGAKQKFEEVEASLNKLYKDAQAKFAKLDEKVTGNHKNDKKMGFLPDKMMMIPKVFSDDVTSWRKWKDDVAK